MFVNLRVVDGSISIHALLAESDILGALWVLSIQIFLSTLSLRRATIVSSALLAIHTFLSTLSLRRATLPGRLGFLSFPFLSTLSLRRATD